MGVSDEGRKLNGNGSMQVRGCCMSVAESSPLSRTISFESRRVT